MNIDIQTQGMPTPAAQASLLRYQLNSVLGNRSDFVKTVLVRLGGAHGIGGKDCHCLMQVQFCESFVATVAAIGPDMQHAINCATQRLGRLVGNHLVDACRDDRASASARKLGTFGAPRTKANQVANERHL